MKIGIDLGGSHIAIGVVEQGKIIKKIEKLWTKKDKESLKEIMTNYIIEKSEEIMKQYDIEGLGIGMPGTQRNGVIINSGKLQIENYPIVQKLQEIINIPVKIRNDAKCAAIAEDKYGYLKDYRRSLFITLGTGIGGAVLINHQLLDTGDNPGCEVGHMIIEKNGLKCTCGNKGCWQQYASMKVFKNKLREILGLDETIHGEQLVEIMKQKKIEKEKQQKVEELIEEYVESLGIGISNLINIFEPEAIGIGGSFVFFEDILLKKLKKKILNEKLLFNQREELKMFPAVLGNDAGIIGATLI